MGRKQTSKEEKKEGKCSSDYFFSKGSHGNPMLPLESIMRSLVEKEIFSYLEDLSSAISHQPERFFSSFYFRS